ncbi:hypothetical protein DKT74_37330 [Streptomyces sp. ZEA17I]|nr:hypothetical protein DKT74_37330 [Streptomyces sp. ZEA17I]
MGGGGRPRGGRRPGGGRRSVLMTWDAQGPSCPPPWGVRFVTEEPTERATAVPSGDPPTSP